MTTPDFVSNPRLPAPFDFDEEAYDEARQRVLAAEQRRQPAPEDVYLATVEEVPGTQGEVAILSH